VSHEDILSTDTGRQPRRRVGRGLGSGLGKTGGRGSKGEGSRTGGKNRGPLFEGGQFPFWMRLPKRGFSNHAHKRAYQAIDLMRVLKHLPGDAITVEALVAARLVAVDVPVKLVGSRVNPGAAAAPLTRKLAIDVHRVTASVKAAVEAAGGTVVERDRAGASETGTEAT
jgi:large subunit ribosomal protein L15